jgi:hypothetical protein
MDGASTPPDYVSLLADLVHARDTLNATIQVVQKALEQRFSAEAEGQANKPRCARCGGSGRIGARGTGDYCACQMGRDLKQVEHRMPDFLLEGN